MSTGVFDPKWRGPPLWRAACVFALVLLLHVWALYVFSRGLSAVVPADATQTTLSVSLLAPPPAPAPSAQAPKPAPRPRARNAPTITPPLAPDPAPDPAPAPPPVEPPSESPPEPPPVAAEAPATASTAAAHNLASWRTGAADQGPHCLSNVVHAADRHHGADVRRLVDRSRQSDLRALVAHGRSCGAARSAVDRHAEIIRHCARQLHRENRDRQSRAAR